jgi:type VI secretion system VasD/TssJ family lipoprotein
MRGLVHVTLLGALLALSAAGAVGCGGTREVPVVVVPETSFHVDLDLVGQPDQNGGGYPARLFIYKLSNDANFQSTPFDAFWQDDQPPFGTELLGSEQFRIYPDERKEAGIEVSNDARYLGIAADLRAPTQDLWRTALPVEQVRGKRLVVTLRADRLAVELK